MIRICLMNVDLPDSPVPENEKVKTKLKLTELFGNKYDHNLIKLLDA